MALHSSGALQRWASGIDRPQRCAMLHRKKNILHMVLLQEFCSFQTAKHDNLLILPY
jgi:hypothetical protein